MFSTKSLAAATAAFALFASSTAEYDPNGKGNTVVYWGSGSNQQRLSYYCYDDSIDIIPIAFIDSFPAQANGLVGEAYSSNACWAGPTYAGPGYPVGNITTANNVLLTECPYIQQDLYDCQQNTKTKFLISLGGATGNYQLDTAADGVYLANFLWGAYGPYQQSWVDAGGIRPFDGGFDGTNTSMKIDIDGFDFDIEKTSPNNQAGYIACINQLRVLFDAYKLANPCSKDYLITGAPQCPRPDANMSNTINLAQFDIIWPQFYNNGPAGCTARDWANGNTAGFNFESWASDLLTGASKDAKLYIGLLGGASGSSSAPGDYLTPAEAKSLIAAFESQTAFGGVMLWDAVSSSDSTDSLTSYKYANGSAIPASAAYYDVIKNYLDVYATPYTPTPSVCSSTTSSTSSTKTSTSTGSSIATTSSVTPTTTSSSSSSVHTTSSTSTSSTPTSTSTSSSSSSSPTKSSTSSTTSSAFPTSTSSSTSSVPTTSSTSTTPTTSSTSSSLATSSSSSSSALPTTSSSSSSSSTTSSAAATSTTPTVPTHVPSVGSCVRIGCYTEGYNVRALTPFVYTDYAVMSPEICASKTPEYLYFGVEYGGECYGGNEINNGSVIVPDSQCDMTCGGYPGEYCGSGDRLDLYYCGGSTSSSSAAPTTSSTLSSAAVSTSSSSSVAVSTSSSSSSSSAVPTTSSSSYSSATASSSSSISSGPGSYPSSSLNSSYTTSSSSSSVTASASLSVSSGPGSYPSSSLNSSYTTSSSNSSVTASTSLSVSSGPGSYPSSSLNGSYPTSSSSLTATTSLSVSSGPGSYPTSSLNSSYSTSSSSRTRKSACSSHTKSSTGNSTYPTSTLSSTGTGSGGATSSSGSSSYPTTSSTGTGSVVGTSSSGSSSYLTTSTPSSTGTGSGGAVTTSSSISYTTSTVSTTTVYTITSCAATVTDCPARIGKVTTDTIVLYTTYCPVTATETGGGIPTSTPATSSPGVEYTTSTVYATTTYTITSCAPTVTNCPAKLGQVTTDTISLYVTVCPVSEAGSKAVSTANAAATSPSNTYSTTTVSSTTTQYVTVKVVPSTATLVPYPVSPTSQAKALGTGAGTSLPAVSLITTTAGAATTASPSPVQFKGAASTSRGPIGFILAVVLGAVIFMM